MACDFINAYKSTGESCKITMAGTGDRVYFFDKDAWKKAIAEADSITTKGLPAPGYKGYYGLDEAGAEDTEAIAKLALLELYGVDIKTDSGQVTSEKAAENEAASQIGTFVVADNIENFNELAHTLAFRDWGCIIPRIGGGFYMVMSPYKKCTLSNNYDSGTTYDSDHGFTATVNASPCEYGVTFLPDGSANAATYDTVITETIDDSSAATVTVAKKS